MTQPGIEPRSPRTLANTNHYEDSILRLFSDIDVQAPHSEESKYFKGK